MNRQTLPRSYGQAILDSIDETLETASVRLTNAELKSLLATPKTLVPTPGPYHWIEVTAATLLFHAGVDPLGPVANLQIGYTDSGGLRAGSAIVAANFLSATEDQVYQVPGMAGGLLGSAQFLLDQPLVIYNAGSDEEAGNTTDDATLTVIILYRLCTAP